jgi:hypothetical protein
MAILSSSIVINQLVVKVFALMSEVEKYPTWRPSVTRVKVTPVGPIAVGSTYTQTTQDFVPPHRLVNSQIKMKVSAFEPNRKWAVKVVGDLLHMEIAYLFEATGTGTRMTLSEEIPGSYGAAIDKVQWMKALEEKCRALKQAIEDQADH